MNTDMVIDGAKYRGVASLDFGISSSITDKTMENGELAHDHIEKQQISLSLSLKFYSNVFTPADTMGSSHEASLAAINSGEFNRMDQFLFIMDLWDNKLTFDIVCDLGYFDNMVVKSVKVVEDSNSSTSFDANIDLGKFMPVQFEGAVFQYITDSDGKVVGAAPMGNYGAVTLKKPPKQGREPSWGPFHVIDWNGFYDWSEEKFGSGTGWNHFWKGAGDWFN